METSSSCRELSRSRGSHLAEVVPADILALVFRRLNLDDFFRFGAVCRRLIAQYQYPLRTRVHYQVLSVVRNRRLTGALFSGVPNHSTRTIHDFVKVREIDPKFECHGSSFGWLVVVERQRHWNSYLGKRKMRLLNPVSGQQLSLPDFSWPDLEPSFAYFCKFVLSSYPSSSSATTVTCFVVAAAYGYRPKRDGQRFSLSLCDYIIFFEDSFTGLVNNSELSYAWRTWMKLQQHAVRVTEIVTCRAPLKIILQ
ncbi:hypothetical protein H6P81_009455 [Aristolochia fimbriata]|uniref:KIB1-4 beta-propeller domain-containing protein n=1 Tax=Aristolochia fimbriata TaxID=158543 RepID=A0AAV7EKZ5_ARIFI|nr:hypothetical protein H6P81_009455 [Aristolochia fimbriata]